MFLHMTSIYVIAGVAFDIELISFQLLPCVEEGGQEIKEMTRERK